MNKYERVPDYILDLHGYTTGEAEGMLQDVIKSGKHGHVRVITGKGTFRPTGPVLKTFVRNFLVARNIKFAQSKISDGGEGAFEVFLK